MDDSDDSLPVRLFAESVAILGIPTAAIIFFVSLIGSGGVGYGPRRNAELLFRAEFMAGLILAIVIAGIPIAFLLLRDPKASVQRWVVAGLLCGLVTGLAATTALVWPLVMMIGIPTELIGNWIAGIVIAGLLGAVAALPIRALTLYRFNRKA